MKCFLTLLSLALLAATMVIAVSINSPTTEQRSSATLVKGPNAARRTFALLNGIPQHGSTLGYTDAPVTLQFFGDLQCKMSRQVMLGALPLLIRHWVRAGKLQIRFRSKETDTNLAGGWAEFREQQAAALAAGRQDKLWNFIDVFYREQGPEFTGYVDRAFLDGIATKAGVEIAEWEKDRDPDIWFDLINADEELAKRTGADATPTFLIGRSGQRPHLLLHYALEEPKGFDEAIRELL